jgi:hypothetical protein
MIRVEGNLNNRQEKQTLLHVHEFTMNDSEITPAINLLVLSSVLYCSILSLCVYVASQYFFPSLASQHI